MTQLYQIEETILEKVNEKLKQCSHAMNCLLLLHLAVYDTYLNVKPSNIQRKTMKQKRKEKKREIERGKKEREREKEEKKREIENKREKEWERERRKRRRK